MLLSARLNLPIRASDGNQAFLNATLKERILIQPPQHLAEVGKVWLMKKALYGLKQAGRAWYYMYRDLLVEFGYKVSNFDPCLFFMRQGGKISIIGVHVDDSLMIFQDEKQWKNLLLFLQ